ncbi:MAG: hypothetical protein ABEJ34_02390 [Haloferacaceae archaeon]
MSASDETDDVTGVPITDTDDTVDAAEGGPAAPNGSISGAFRPAQRFYEAMRSTDG